MKRPTALIAIPATAFVLLCLMDILREPPPWDPVELGLDIAEKAVLVLMVIAVIWSLQRIADMREDQQAVHDHLARQAAQGRNWQATRASEIAALSDAIAFEFRAWGLTAAEIDVASLLLKGASMKEIALARKTSEATIRQQAQSMYRKAGLSGRVELSAYFLDSLFEEIETERAVRLRAVDSD
jgi:DNA-binding CsgD family transcriptional regulator